ncbi:hypothetical protein F4778DRAFT_781628 [Xylariomycetidae sp. FL2044]|nr:hypothetical protein F4778DRAFT_781628 [Xylariomycetidae sp. FL2044]
MKRSGSRRSMKAGSVRSLTLQSSHEPDETHSAFFCPVPTAGNPTEILAKNGIIPGDIHEELEETPIFYRTNLSEKPAHSSRLNEHRPGG